MAKTTKEPASPKQRQAVSDRLKAMSHPLRRSILQLIRDKGERSPVEVSWELAAELQQVSYHVRELAKLGYLEKVREERVRGAYKSFYIATDLPLIDTEEWGSFEPSEKVDALVHFMQPIVDDFAAAIKAGTLGEDGDWIITRTPVHATDARGFEEMRDAHRELFERVLEIQRESLERMAESGEEPIAVSSGQTCFAMKSF